MAWLNPFERASLYVALHTYLAWLAEGAEEPPLEVLNFFESLGVNLPRKVLEATSEYVRRFRASLHRTDLTPAARANLQNQLAAFYSSAGYVSTEPADSLLAMTAFAARLAMDAYKACIRGDAGAEKIERFLHRFVNTHLIPALKHLKPTEEELAHAIDGLTRIVSEDAGILASRFSRATDH